MHCYKLLTTQLKVTLIKINSGHADVCLSSLYMSQLATVQLIQCGSNTYSALS